MFGIENVFTFVLNFFFFFCIWIGNESEDRVAPYLVRIRQSGQVGYGATIGILQLNLSKMHCGIVWISPLTKSFTN